MNPQIAALKRSPLGVQKLPDAAAEVIPAEPVTAYRPRPPVDFVVNEIVGADPIVSLRWTVERPTQVIIERKLPSDADFVRINKVPTAHHTLTADNHLPCDTEIAYRIACVEDNMLSDFVVRQIKTGARPEKSAIQVVREQAAAAEAESARLSSENRHVGLRRYTEILLNPDATPGAGDAEELQMLMNDLGISPKRVEADTAIVHELLSSRENLRTCPVMDSEKMKKMVDAVAQLKKDLHQAELDTVRYRSACGMRMQYSSRIEHLPRQRPELFQPVTPGGEIRLMCEA